MAVFKNWEILREGTHTDKSGKSYTFTKETLSDLVTNYNENKAINSKAVMQLGYVKVGGHREININDMPAAGWVKSLSLQEKEGKAIVAAEATDVPEGIKNIIDRKGLQKTSAEVLVNYQGKGPMLRAVSIMSREPAIGGMAAPEAYEFASKKDLLAAYDVTGDEFEKIGHLFSSSELVKLSFRGSDSDQPGAGDTNKNKEGDSDMTPEEIAKAIAKAKKEGEEEAVAKFSSDQKKLETSQDKLKNELDAAKTLNKKNEEKLAKFAADEAKKTKDNIAAFCKSLSTDSRVVSAIVKGCDVEGILNKLDSNELVKFAVGDNKTEEKTVAKQAMHLLENVVKLAKEGKLFVANGEAVPGATEEELAALAARDDKPNGLNLSAHIVAKNKGKE